MRQSFSSKLPVSDQLKRIVKIAAGHKHMHRKGPGRRSAEQRQKTKHVQAVQRAKRKKQLAATRAYWSGESDEHP